VADKFCNFLLILIVVLFCFEIFEIFFGRVCVEILISECGRNGVNLSSVAATQAYVLVFYLRYLS
jgi:NADH:ubiquinone oxidoreductase subunit K